MVLLDGGGGGDRRRASTVGGIGWWCLWLHWLVVFVVIVGCVGIRGVYGIGPPAGFHMRMVYGLLKHRIKYVGDDKDSEEGTKRWIKSGSATVVEEFEAIVAREQDLAQNRYFEDEAFIGYLKYLQYWQRPEYIKFIMYPHCLFFLELLQNPAFHNAMAHPANKQFDFWKNFRNSRLKHILRRPLPEPATAPPTSAPPALLPTSVAPPAAPPPAPSPVTAAALSPMQYAIPPGFGLAKTGPRNASVDRRKRKNRRPDSSDGLPKFPRTPTNKKFTDSARHRPLQTQKREEHIPHICSNWTVQKNGLYLHKRKNGFTPMENMMCIFHYLDNVSSLNKNECIRGTNHCHLSIIASLGVTEMAMGRGGCGALNSGRSVFLFLDYTAFATKNLKENLRTSKARSQPLLMDTFPGVNQACALVVGDEGQKVVLSNVSNIGMNFDGLGSITMYSQVGISSGIIQKYKKNSLLVCDFCKCKGHRKEFYYKLDGEERMIHIILVVLQVKVLQYLRIFEQSLGPSTTVDRCNVATTAAKTLLVSDNSEMWIIDTGSTAHMVFSLDMLAKESFTQKEFVFAVKSLKSKTSKESTMELWYQKLGHVSPVVLARIFDMPKQNQPDEALLDVVLDQIHYNDDIQPNIVAFPKLQAQVPPEYRFEVESEARRSTRSKHKPTWLRDFIFLNISKDIHYLEFVKNQRWVDAMQAEIRALESNKTWEIKDLSPRKKLIGSVVFVGLAGNGSGGNGWYSMAVLLKNDPYRYEEKWVE
ncbi:Mediator of RNA polymerase II transcription subunit 31 [Capsicum annuum]|nr:Mediator of RNA polymerase II transcription subunit 31 [Capsicum annuum]